MVWSISDTVQYCFSQFCSRDGIRKSEGTIGTEPTHGYSQLTLKNVWQIKCHFI